MRVETKKILMNSFFSTHNLTAASLYGCYTTVGITISEGYVSKVKR